MSQGGVTLAVMGYRGKVEAQARARELRAEGWRLADIARELGVSKGSVSVWVRDVVTPEIERWRGTRRPSRLHLERLAAEDSTRVWATERVGGLSDRERFVVGLALYAGEGAKTGATVDFVNSDPNIVAFYTRWLREFFPIDEPRLHARLQLHAGLDLVRATEFWSAITGISVDRFKAPHRSAPSGGRKARRHEHGLVTVRYCSAPVLRMVLSAIDSLLSSSGLPG